MIVIGPVERLQWLKEIQNAMPRDHRALAVAVRLLENAGNETGKCWPSIKTLADALQCEETTVRRGLKQLEANSFILIKGRGGRSGDHGIPNIYTLINPSKSATLADKQPLQIGASTLAHLSSNPGTFAGQTCLKNSSQELTSNAPRLERSNGIKISDSQTTSPLQGFERFWHVYPWQVGRKKAERAWQMALKRAPEEIIVKGAIAYSKKSDDRRWMNPANWLKEERWTDQLSDDADKNGHGHSSPTSAATPIRILVEKDSEQWHAWCIAKGKSSFPLCEQRDANDRVRIGWFFPSEWPPGHEPAQASPPNCEPVAGRDRRIFSDRLTGGATEAAVRTGRSAV